MTHMTTTAGQRLHAKYEAALQRAAQECGRALEWTEAEEVALRLATESADKAERVKAMLDAELAEPQPNSMTVTKLSGEWRLLNKATMDYVWRLNPGLDKAKSPRHQRAGRMRHTPRPTWAPDGPRRQRHPGPQCRDPAVAHRPRGARAGRSRHAGMDADPAEL